MKKWSIILFILFNVSAMASAHIYGLEQDFVAARLDLILKMQTARALKELNANFQNLEDLSRRCQLELKMKAVPAYCYEFSNLMFERKLLTSEQLTQNLERLDNLCLTSASLDQTHKRDLETLSKLGPKCRQAVEKVIEIAKYKGQI